MYMNVNRRRGFRSSGDCFWLDGRARAVDRGLGSGCGCGGLIQADIYAMSGYYALCHLQTCDARSPQRTAREECDVTRLGRGDVLVLV